MSWKDTLRKAPFYVDELGNKQPTEDTHPEIVEMFEDSLGRIKNYLDKQDLNWEEKLKYALDQLDDLQTQKYRAFFLKRPLYNKKIKELEQEIITFTRLLQNRPQREQSERNWAADQLRYKVEIPKWLEEQDKKMNQILDDMMVDLGKEPKGTAFQQDHA